MNTYMETDARICSDSYSCSYIYRSPYSYRYTCTYEVHMHTLNHKLAVQYSLLYLPIPRPSYLMASPLPPAPFRD